MKKQIRRTTMLDIIFSFTVEAVELVAAKRCIGWTRFGHIFLEAGKPEMQARGSDNNISCSGAGMSTLYTDITWGLSLYHAHSNTNKSQQNSLFVDTRKSKFTDLEILSLMLTC